MDIKPIYAEQLNRCTFTRSVGYSTPDDKREHSRKLHLCMLLANHPNNNVRIVFNTIDGYREILTAVWGATEKFILLNGGSFIPVDAVAYVTFEV